MTITFYSNFLNFHQIPFCEAMVREIGNGFTFVATEEIAKERLSMGFQDVSHQVQYTLNSYESEVAWAKAMKLGLESDVAIIGSAPNCFIEERLRQNKLTFRYSERFFKEGRWRIFDPRVLRARYRQDIANRNKNLYMLCASAYTASDCRFIHSYPDKTYKWGYFPPVKKYDNIEEIIRWKHHASILWVGRLIRWKHPEDTIYAAEKLKLSGYKFNLGIIGDGELRPKLENMIQKKGLADYVQILGFMAPGKVREHMEKADIYLFTSDRNEGWGAVLNESMNSACAVVANREIGSVPYLIRDGENGLVYERKKNNLYEKIKALLDDEGRKKAIQMKAYETMTETWNANVATKRLLHLIECLQNGIETGYENGPCSRD